MNNMSCIHCPNCGEQSSWAENTIKLTKYMDENSIKILSDDNWPKEIPRNHNTVALRTLKPGGIYCLSSTTFITGSNLLRRLSFGRIHQSRYRVTLRTYGCHTCGTTWVSEDKCEI